MWANLSEKEVYQLVFQALEEAVHAKNPHLITLATLTGHAVRLSFCCSRSFSKTMFLLIV